MMATRSGSIDPGVLLALLRDGRLTADELDDVLQHRSGLLGVGGSGDMRVLLARQAAGHPAASLAVELYIDRAAAAIAASATRLPALDALVVTGGIGEHAEPVVDGITRRLGVLGIPRLSRASQDGTTDADRDPDADAILAAATPGPGLVRIRAREDLVIARAVERLSAA
jgi:acetate kinase